MKSNVFICPPCGESVALATKEGQNKNKTLWPLLPCLTAVLPPQGREMSFGFTLIELLVVVLIIGILAAVAVPQYQVAVKKADLARYMSLVAAMKEAEEVYYLANGEYTEEIEQLDIGMPLTTTCELSSDKEHYDCGNVRMGIFNGSNVQAGNNTIRYVQFFTTPQQKNYIGKVKKGDIVCQARGSVAIKACQNLGGQEVEIDNGWDKNFILK